jgi:DNA-binding CsgD family transcriptional regulator
VPRLIELIYDAAEDPSRWPKFLEEIADATGSSRASLAIVPPKHLRASIGCLYGWSEEEIRLYGDRYGAHDPFRAGIDRMPEGVVGTNYDLCSDEELEQSLAYREFYAPRNTHYGCGCTIIRSPEGLSMLTVTRSREAGAYGERELALMRPLIPHLQRAVRVHGELTSLRSQLAAFGNLLDLYPQPFLLTDADCAVLYANASARELGKRDGTLTIESGTLAVTSYRGNDALRKAVRQVASNPESRLRRLDVQGARANPCRLLLMPVPRPHPRLLGVAQMAVAILVIDLDSGPRPDPAMLAELYALTPAEARFTASLVSGFSLEEISGQLSITRETARTHMRRVLSKTQTRRQGELISLLLRSIPFSRQDAVN